MKTSQFAPFISIILVFFVAACQNSGVTSEATFQIISGKRDDTEKKLQVLIQGPAEKVVNIRNTDLFKLHVTALDEEESLARANHILQLIQTEFQSHEGQTNVVIWESPSIKRISQVGQDFGIGIVSIIPLGLLLICFIVWILALVHMLTSRTIHGADKIVWTLVIIFLNILGAIIYFAVRPFSQPKTTDANK